MSLETVYQKFKNVESISFKKLLLACLFPALVSLGIALITNSTYLSQYEDPIVQVIMISMITASFWVISLSTFAGGLVVGIGIIWFLLKTKNIIYTENGKFIGESLSTNNEFLRKLADGLLPRIIGIIRGYNDPKFEELEQKDQREKIELKKENTELKTKVKELEELILPHIGRQNRNQFDFNLRLKKLEQKKNEDIQTIGDKAQTKINTENNDIKKFKDIDE